MDYDGEFPAGLKILIVDDDSTFLLVLESMLRKLSYQVTKCESARDALALLREDKSRFDIVLCDLHMPVMNGLKLLEIIRLEMDLPVVIMSCDDGKGVIMKGIIHGACDYLVKPIKIESLQVIWQHVVRNRRRKHMFKDQFHHPNVADRMPARDKIENEEEEKENLGEYSSDEVTTAKKRRVIWSRELHEIFVTAVTQLGRDRAVPKKILERMQAIDVTGLCTGLSRANIASHLQKYRLHNRKVGQSSSDNRDAKPLFNLQFEPTTGHQFPLQNLNINPQPIRYQRANEDLISADHPSHDHNIYVDSVVPELTHWTTLPTELSSHGTNMLFQNDEQYVYRNVGDDVSEISNSISDVEELMIYEPSFYVRQYDQDQFFRGPFA